MSDGLLEMLEERLGGNLDERIARHSKHLHLYESILTEDEQREVARAHLHDMAEQIIWHVEYGDEMDFDAIYAINDKLCFITEKAGKRRVTGR